MMEPNKISQIVANTPNIIIYANFEGYSRCKIPTVVCHQFVINQHNPLRVKNTLNKPQNIVLGVVGL